MESTLLILTFSIIVQAHWPLCQFCFTKGRFINVNINVLYDFKVFLNIYWAYVYRQLRDKVDRKVQLVLPQLYTMFVNHGNFAERGKTRFLRHPIAERKRVWLNEIASALTLKW